MEKCSGGREIKVYELAICFARMWGVAETLSPLPNLGFSEVKERMIRWAEEYVEAGEGDFLLFFRRKLAETEKADGKEEDSH